MIVYDAFDSRCLTFNFFTLALGSFFPHSARPSVRFTRVVSVAFLTLFNICIVCRSFILRTYNKENNLTHSKFSWQIILWVAFSIYYINSCFNASVNVPCDPYNCFRNVNSKSICFYTGFREKLCFFLILFYIILPLPPRR